MCTNDTADKLFAVAGCAPTVIYVQWDISVEPKLFASFLLQYSNSVDCWNGWTNIRHTECEVFPPPGDCLILQDCAAHSQYGTQAVLASANHASAQWTYVVAEQVQSMKCFTSIKPQK